MSASDGPWSYSLVREELRAVVYGHGKQHVADVYSGSRPSLEVAEANAKLICAALAMRGLLLHSEVVFP